MKTNQLTKLMAIGTIATGIAAVFSATPARAASFNGGDFNFTGVTSNFYTLLTNTAINNSFQISFNPFPGRASIFANTLTVPSGVNTASSLTRNSFQTITPATVGTFFRTGSTAFTLTNPLSMTFTTGTRVIIGAGNLFRISSFNANAVNLGFASGNGFGTIWNGSESTTTDGLSFTVSDLSGPSTGNYGLLATKSTPVPEPLTVIGTIIGGAAALRMRKKLSAVSNN